MKLWCDCPFWPDDGMCSLRDCSVCECQEGKHEATVDRTLDAKSFNGWVEIDNPWTNDDETDNGNTQ